MTDKMCFVVFMSNDEICFVVVYLKLYVHYSQFVQIINYKKNQFSFQILVLTKYVMNIVLANFNTTQIIN